MKIFTYLWLLVSFATFSTYTVGKETQDNQLQLLTSCQALAAESQQVSSSACIYYIQGFLAGMRFSETLNPAPLDEANNPWPAFIERAHRTRVGDQPKPKQSVRFKYFCLPNDEPLSEVINVLSKPLSSPIETVEKLKAKILNTLRVEYPCVQS